MPFTIPHETDAGFADQAELDSVDFEIFLQSYQQTGVISGCAVTAQGSPDMTVAVAAGVVEVTKKRAAVTAGNVTVSAADGTNPRFDLIHVDDAGTKGITAGTPAASPVFPAHPALKVVLAAVYVPASDTDIDTNQIVDKRVMITRFDPIAPLVSGQWNVGMWAAANYNVNGFTPVLGRLYYWPFLSQRRCTYDRIGMYIDTAGAAGKVARLGIYDSDANGQPSTLVVDAGEFAVDTTGAKEQTISQELEGGRLYWLAFHSDGVPLSKSSTSMAMFYMGRLDSGSSARQVRNLYETFTYGALPSTVGTLVYTDVNTGMQMVTLRMA